MVYIFAINHIDNYSTNEIGETENSCQQLQLTVDCCFIQLTVRMDR